jgi:hypothetical protein
MDGTVGAPSFMRGEEPRKSLITDGVELTPAGTMTRLSPRRLSESKPATGKYHDFVSLAL